MKKSPLQGNFIDSLSQFCQIVQNWKGELLRSLKEDKHFHGFFKSSRTSEKNIQTIVNKFFNEKMVTMVDEIKNNLLL